MTRKNQTQQIADLREQLTVSMNNQEMLAEAMSVLEYDLEKQGWFSLFNAQTGRELSKDALNTLYDLTREYWMKNPLIRRAVEVQCLYVFAQGMDVKADHPTVDVAIQRFNNDPKNYTSFTGHQAWIQNERDLALSGNQFYALLTDDVNGRVIVRSIPLYEIEDIVCNPEDRNEPWYYRRVYSVNVIQDNGSTVAKNEIRYYPDWRYNPDEKPETFAGKPVEWTAPIYHVKTNCLPDMKFGVSEMYAAIDWAKAYKRFQENWSKLVEAYARYAFNLTMKGGTSAKISAAKSAIETKFSDTDPNTGTMRDTTYRPVATTIVSGEGVKLDTVRTQGATTSSADARGLLLMVCSACGIPEQIESCDPSTGNLATAKAMERPLELQFINRQTLWKDVWWDICQYVITQAIKANKLKGHEEEDEFTGEVVYVLDEVDEDGELITRDVTITFPPLLEHDVNEMTAAITDAANSGTVDNRTICGMYLSALNVENWQELQDTLWPLEDEAGNPIPPTFPKKAEPMVPQIGADPAIESLVSQASRDLGMFSEADDDGRWVTINGQHILIKDGETTGQAFKRATGKSLSGGGDDKKDREKVTKQIFKQKKGEVDTTVKTLYSGIDQNHQLDIMSRSDISKEELDAVGTYQSAGYLDINAQLRGVDTSKRQSSGSEIAGDKKAISDHIALLNSAIDKSPAPEGLALYRGVSGKTGSALDKLEVGSIIEDKGFQSFSSDPSVGHNFARGVARPTDKGAQEVKTVMQYVTGKGDKALPILGEKAGFESEFVLKPGKFRVMDVSEYKSGPSKITKVIQVVAA